MCESTSMTLIEAAPPLKMSVQRMKKKTLYAQRWVCFNMVTMFPYSLRRWRNSFRQFKVVLYSVLEHKFIW